MFTRIRGLAVWNPSHRKMQTCIVVSLLFFPGCFRIVGIQVLTSHKRSSLDSSRIETKEFQRTPHFVVRSFAGEECTCYTEGRATEVGYRIKGGWCFERQAWIPSKFFFEYLF